MDKNEAIKIAERYIKIVNKKYKIENAFIFGSFAKGSHHVESDIDIAIVFNQIDDIIELQAELMWLRNDEDLYIEPHPFSLSDFNRANPIVEEIIKNGIEIKNFAA
jgi:predicted nucleotidyltransferase